MRYSSLSEKIGKEDAPKLGINPKHSVFKKTTETELKTLF